MRILVFLIAALLAAPWARAADEQSYDAFLAQQAAAGNTPGAPAAPRASGAGKAENPGLGFTATPDERAALGKALYDDHIRALEYNRRVFEWQMTSTIVSFWVVIALVACGLVFAAIQFARAMRRKPGADGTPGEDLTTDLEISGKGLKISSPVLGVIILALSLGFFYFYLRYVYPIEHVRGMPPSADATAPVN